METPEEGFMRTSILTAAILVGVWTMPALERATPLNLAPLATVAAQEPANPPASPPPSQPSQSQPTTSEPRSAQPAPTESQPVNVQVTNRWYFSPIWLAIGIIGAIVVIMLIVMASKSEGNTVIRG